MPYLIVRTDVRTIGPDEIRSAWRGDRRLRDERTTPEMRRQLAYAEDRESAFRLARALSAVGAVRSGRQRVKVVRVGEPEQPRTAWRPEATVAEASAAELIR